MAGATLSRAAARAREANGSNGGPRAKSQSASGTPATSSAAATRSECRINGELESTATKMSPHAGRIGFQLEGFLYELRNVTVTPLD